MKNKCLKIVILFLAILLLINFSIVQASEVVDLMTGVTTPDGTDSGVASAINNVIGLFQFAGTGIAVFVVTVLGIKYMLAAPSEKADVKKNIMPIIIGCILLFGAVNIVAIILTVSDGSFAATTPQQ